MLTSLEQQIQFYLSYRKLYFFLFLCLSNATYVCADQDKANRLLHMVSVPLLYLSFLLFATYLNSALVLTFAYVLYVFYLDSVVGSAFLPFAILLYSVALNIRFNTSSATGLVVALVMHIGAWVIQLAGHSAEGSKPAFLTSLVHAALAAPLVIYLEALFSLGLLPDTQARLDGARELTVASTGTQQPAPAEYGGTDTT